MVTANSEIVLPTRYSPRMNKKVDLEQFPGVGIGTDVGQSRFFSRLLPTHLGATRSFEIVRMVPSLRMAAGDVRSPVRPLRDVPMMTMRRVGQ